MVMVWWVGFAAGVVLVLANFNSIVGTIILPRMISSRITFVAWRVVYLCFLALARRRPRYESKDRLLALLGPVSLLATLAAWLLLFVLGFALLFWPLVGGDVGAALRLSGSSLFTLGVAASPDTGPIVLEFMAAATGMITIALQIGYLPAIYGAYNKRETLVTALSARAGMPPWGPEILARHQLNQSLSTMPALYAAWENWAADIAESHVSYPWLLSFRSPHPHQSWLVSLLAMLDSAALYLALSPDQAPPECRQFVRMGYVALRKLAGVVGIPVQEDPRPDDPILLSYEEFTMAVAHLQRAGFSLERTASAAWPHFRGWRVNYEAVAYQLADFLVAVPALWSGERSHMAVQDRTAMGILRPPHRTPADPEGVAAIVVPVVRRPGPAGVAVTAPTRDDGAG